MARRALDLERVMEFQGLAPFTTGASVEVVVDGRVFDLHNSGFLVSYVQDEAAKTLRITWRVRKTVPSSENPNRDDLIAIEFRDVAEYEPEGDLPRPGRDAAECELDWIWYNPPANGAGLVELLFTNGARVRLCANICQAWLTGIDVRSLNGAN